MKNADIIILDMQNLLEINREPDEDIYFEDEYGHNVTDYIDCPYTGSDKCLNEIRGVEYKEKGWNDNCSECKARWLLEENE